MPVRVSKAVSNTILLDLKPRLRKTLTPGGILISVTLFTIVGLLNTTGLMPYVFTPPRHLSVAVRLALPLWVGHYCYSWARNPQPMFAHLVPLGTPGALMPFMVIIELVSGLIRPITLSVRLAANMTAGHLLLSLVTGPAGTSAPITLLVIVSAVLLCALETGVAIIQAYVFTVLSALYISEVDSPEIVNT